MLLSNSNSLSTTTNNPPTPPPQPLSVNLSDEQFTELLGKLTVMETQSEDMDDADIDDDNGFFRVLSSTGKNLC